MTFDEMVKLFEDGQNRETAFSLRDLDGLLKINDLGVVDNSKDIIACAEHDQVWLSVGLSKLAEVAIEDDINYLIDCGIWLDEDHDSLSMFV